MPVFYHGSGEYFERPDPARIGGRQSWGFYAATSAHDAYGYAADRGGPDRVVYRMQVPETDFNSRWIKSGQPIGQKHYTALLAAARNRPDVLAQLKALNPNTDASLFSWLPRGKRVPGLSPQEGAQMMARAGIDGMSFPDYAVFYDPQRIGPGGYRLEPMEGFGKFKDIEKGKLAVQPAAPAAPAREAAPAKKNWRAFRPPAKTGDAGQALKETGGHLYQANSHPDGEASAAKRFPAGASAKPLLPAEPVVAPNLRVMTGSLGEETRLYGGKMVPGKEMPIVKSAGAIASEAQDLKTALRIFSRLPK